MSAVWLGEFDEQVIAVRERKETVASLRMRHSKVAENESQRVKL